MKIIFYYDERSLNDATLHYIKIIEKAINAIGGYVLYTNGLHNVNKNDVIFTITTTYYLKAKIKYPFQKTFFWAQGVDPEEYKMSKDNPLKYKIKTIVEYLSIKTSTVLFLVSEKMLTHYKHKYKYKGSNFIIMPCYNLNYEQGSDYSENERYNNLSFVYAGTLSTWQCIEKTLEIFQKIQNELDYASLTLLVKDSEKALEMIEKYRLKNVVVKYVKLNELQSELRNYKYGFIIREDIIVNNVSTPTKMNSYLASGIIPIFTDAVYSFVDNIHLGKDYTICLHSKDSSEIMATEILKYENKITSVSELNLNIKRIFDIYYNDDFYIEKIKKVLEIHFK